MWDTEPQAGRFTWTQFGDQEIESVRLVARGMKPGTTIACSVAEIDVPLLQIDDQAIGMATLPSGASARILLAADIIPEVVEFWAFRNKRHLSPSENVVPASLLRRTADVSPDVVVSAARVLASLRGGVVSDAFSELADILLAERAEDRIAVTNIVLEHLATHPFQRSYTLGALIAALCSK